MLWKCREKLLYRIARLLDCLHSMVQTAFVDRLKRVTRIGRPAICTSESFRFRRILPRSLQEMYTIPLTRASQAHLSSIAVFSTHLNRILLATVSRCD